jgi:predicted lipid-binding transport protein (Tim44 family)
MFRPKYPTAPTPVHLAYPPAVVQTAVPEQTHAHGCACSQTPAAQQPYRSPAARVSAGQVALYVGGGTAAVLVVGAVLVSMFIALAIGACAVTVCVVVLRSLINGERRSY